MNRQHIVRALRKAGHQVELSNQGSRLHVVFHVGGRPLELVHEFPNDLLRVPKFDLLDGHGFGKLAHVLPCGQGDGGEVCIADVASTSVNTDRPALVYRQTVDEHVGLLTRLINDPIYNRDEQLREFGAHWKEVCRNPVGDVDEIFVAWDGIDTNRLQVRPPRQQSGTPLQTRTIAIAGTLANERGIDALHTCGDWRKRPTVGRGIGLRLTALRPAPPTCEDMQAWYFDAVSHAEAASARELARLHRKRSREYWIVFSAPIPDGRTLFGVRWRAPTKGPLPDTEADARAGHWTVKPFNVRSLSKESLVPRGGGSLDLRRKAVLLVGCGSVGSELAYGLASSGIGMLTASDPDRLSEENLYRHRLSLMDVGTNKSHALARDLKLGYPWTAARPWSKRLEDLRDADLLREFDLVVVAIASPTVERAFAEFCAQANVLVPRLHCWLEGYGIGGHAILVVPGSKGCWHCAYVDAETGARRLTSNLSFLAPGQIVLRQQGGCGAQYLPFSGLAAMRTASMTADLAVRFLADELTASTRVSWRGCAAEAIDAGLETTPRYGSFHDSLRLQALHDPNCDVCGC